MRRDNQEDPILYATIIMSNIAAYILDVAYSLCNCLSCFPSEPNLSLNGRSFKILRLLGEVRTPSNAFSNLSTSSSLPFTQPPSSPSR